MDEFDESSALRGFGRCRTSPMVGIKLYSQGIVQMTSSNTILSAVIVVSHQTLCYSLVIILGRSNNRVFSLSFL
jgi:hypothetical protein